MLKKWALHTFLFVLRPQIPPLIISSRWPIMLTTKQCSLSRVIIWNDKRKLKERQKEKKNLWKLHGNDPAHIGLKYTEVVLFSSHDYFLLYIYIMINIPFSPYKTILHIRNLLFQQRIEMSPTINSPVRATLSSQKQLVVSGQTTFTSSHVAPFLFTSVISNTHVFPLFKLLVSGGMLNVWN